MTEVYLIGAFSTSFGRKADRTYKDLTREAYLGVLADAGMDDGAEIDFAWFGNCTMHLDRQANTRGQVCMAPLVGEGLFPERVPLMNVENACATSASALAAATYAVQGGASQLGLVMGVEKLIEPATGRGRFEAFDGTLDQFDPQEWRTYYAEAGDAAGKPFDLGAGRTPFMDTYAMQACYHMKRYGTTQRQLCVAAANAHDFGAANERAQYRFRVTPEEVMADREISYPLTRAMCAPMGDGAAALLVASGDFLRGAAPTLRERAVRIRACAMSGGKYRTLEERGLSYAAAQRAYAQAGVSPADVDVAEVHDATAFSHVYQCEMLGFCPEGEGGRFVESGETGLGGKVPLNTSGGLIAKGHPIGATGASMIAELVEQLRGEAGARQAEGARLGLAENGGGVIGFDEAVCVVTILERA